MSGLASSGYIDIGANLLDEKFSGVYFGTKRHEEDRDAVLTRALAPEGPCRRVICTSGTIDDSKETLTFTERSPLLYTTCGVHPTRATQGCEGMLEVVKENWLGVGGKGVGDEGVGGGGRVVAIGELGLDYDRLQFADKEAQHTTLLAQLAVNKELIGMGITLPLFLHSRSCGLDLHSILEDHRDSWTTGVVHSFDDTFEVAEKYLELGLYIGVNGCSFKTEDNVEVVKKLPMDRLLLETDAPYCDIRQTHAGHQFVKTTFATVKEKKWIPNAMVKNRMEPCMIAQVAEVVSGAKGLELEQVKQTCWDNSLRLFFPNEKKCKNNES
ncbi:hypothetical protein TrRE_jg9994 [Triparma retinervis]|uniref:TatD related DNase n=1 Tax=Triparma retinervis TaxID=2557542 RepID=A0A9W7DW71_9STRA|nr:hypothetical protein TrRE_jg9994 [Triparma retinervis]